VDAKTKENMRKTEEKLDGRYKEGHERKKPKVLKPIFFNPRLLTLKTLN
jgi:hypothetical protein